MTNDMTAHLDSSQLEEWVVEVSILDNDCEGETLPVTTRLCHYIARADPGF